MEIDESAKLCYECYAYEPPKYFYQNSCIDYIPSNSYCIDSSKQIYISYDDYSSLLIYITEYIINYYNTQNQIITSQYTLEVYDTLSSAPVFNNESKVYLNKCEQVLYDYYHISPPLIIFTIDTINDVK